MSNANQPITNDQQVIDSRDVIARIEYLRGLLADEDTPAGERLTEEEAGELLALESLADEASYGDWFYGELLIHDYYFVEYAQQLAEDIGAIPDENAWPLYCIDWERAARELQMDYTAVDFDGQTYWIRS